MSAEPGEDEEVSIEVEDEEEEEASIEIEEEGKEEPNGVGRLVQGSDLGDKKEEEKNESTSFTFGGVGRKCVKDDDDEEELI